MKPRSTRPARALIVATFAAAMLCGCYEASKPLKVTVSRDGKVEHTEAAPD